MPDGLWSLTKTAYQQSRDSALPADQVVKVAANYTDVADQILAGKITTDAAAKAMLKSANQADVPVGDRPKWATWDAAITAILASHDAELKTNIRLVADAFAAIADGLRRSTTGQAVRCDLEDDVIDDDIARLRQIRIALRASSY